MLTRLVSAQTARLTRYGMTFNSHDLIKVLAISFMVVDHIGLYLLQDNMSYRLIGRAAAPLFYFLIGYDAKLNSRWALLSYGLILSFFSYAVNHIWQANILLTFIAIYYALTYFPPERINTLTRCFFFITFTIINFFVYFYVEYGTLGVLIAYSARLIALEDKQGEFWFLISLIVYYTWESAYFEFYKLFGGMFFFGLMVLALLCLQYYRLKPLYCPKILLWPGLILSRYSLEIYFIHLILFETYKLLHSP